MDPFHSAFASMLRELEDNRLEVVLVPSLYGEGKIRVVQWRNPEWYRSLCAVYLSNRKRKHALPDTRIRRHNIVAVLKRLAQGLPSSSVYVKDLTEIAIERMIEGGEDYGDF